MGMLVVWMACVGLGYMIAKDKGLDPVGHALLGLLLGPIGTVITLMKKGAE